MTNPDDGQPLYKLLLEISGQFAFTQQKIDLLVEAFLKKRLGKAAAAVTKRTVGRLDDEDRLKLFKVVADELNTDADLAEFGGVYRLVKDFRDGVAHSAIFASDGNSIKYHKAVNPQAIHEKTETELLEMRRKGDWLLAQLSYLLSVPPLCRAAWRFVPEGKVRLQPIKPPGRVMDWVSGGPMYLVVPNSLSPRD